MGALPRADRRLRPTVIVFEDLHWADDGMLAFIEHLAAAAPDAPLLLVATTRPELVSGAPRRCSSPSTRASHPVAADPRRRGAPGHGALRRHPRRGRPSADPSSARAVTRSTPRSTCGCSSTAACSSDQVAACACGEGRSCPCPIPCKPCSPPASTRYRTRTRRSSRRRRVRRELLGRRRGGPGGAKEADVDGHEHPRERQLVRRSSMSSFTGEPERVFWHALVRDVAYGELPRDARSQARARRALARG